MSTESYDFANDLRKKKVILSSHFIIEDPNLIPDRLKSTAQALPDGTFKVSGFTIGTVVDQGLHGGITLSFDWSDYEQIVPDSNILRVLWDDEAEPDEIVIDSYPGVLRRLR